MNYSDVALFTDLDGTLFNSDSKVSPENMAAIAHFIAQGGAFGISTGRAPENAKMMLPDLPINTWSVVTNGAAAHLFSEDLTLVQNRLEQDIMLPLVNWVLQTLPQINIMLCTNAGLLFLSPPALADQAFWDSHQPMRACTIADALPLEWMKFLFCAPRSLLEKLEQQAKLLGIPEKAEMVYTNPEYLEFLPFHVNKGACLQSLRTQPSLAGRRFIAIGDYYNDLELLRQADIAVAPANALPEIKALAHHIVTSNDDHALADLIYRVIPTL